MKITNYLMQCIARGTLCRVGYRVQRSTGRRRRRRRRRTSEIDTHTTHKHGQLVKRPEPERFLFSDDDGDDDDDRERDEIEKESERNGCSMMIYNNRAVLAIRTLPQTRQVTRRTAGLLTLNRTTHALMQPIQTEALYKSSKQLSHLFY